MTPFFGYRKPVSANSHLDTLQRLRETLERLEAEREVTPQIASLKRILAARIQEIQSKIA